MGDNRFFMRGGEYDLEIEFPTDVSDQVSSFILYNNGEQIMEAKKAEQ